MPKAERLLALAREKYEPRRATRWPYLMRGDEQFRFEGPNRRGLMADLRAAWRERFPGEAAPAARDLSAVADDLRRLAEQAEPDQAEAEDQAAELLAALGISAVPPDRGLSLVTRLEDCPLPEGYVIPEPYLVAADGIHYRPDIIHSLFEVGDSNQTVGETGAALIEPDQPREAAEARE